MYQETFTNQLPDDNAAGSQLDNPVDARTIAEEEAVLRAFHSVRFEEALGTYGIDGVNGWKVWKLYVLQSGWDPIEALRLFLQTRPDLWCRRFGSYANFFLSEPTYVQMGSKDDARNLAAAQPDLITAFIRENIHVIGGNCGTAFWDSFDKTDYFVTAEEYPGSADDAATYAYVTLHNSLQDEKQSERRD